MTTAVPLTVEGVDLRDEMILTTIGERFAEHLWGAVDGLVTMTVFVESGDVASHVVEVARAVEHAIPGARVRRVHRDLVNQSDIASRVGVSREAVRKWTLRRGEKAFPTPFDTIGGGENRNPSMVWLWSDVVAWLDKAYLIDMDEDFPDDETIAHVDACLAKVKGYLERQWQDAPVVWSIESVLESYLVTSIERFATDEHPVTVHARMRHRATPELKQSVLTRAATASA